MTIYEKIGSGQNQKLRISDEMCRYLIFTSNIKSIRGWIEDGVKRTEICFDGRSITIAADPDDFINFFLT